MVALQEHFQEPWEEQFTDALTTDDGVPTSYDKAILTKDVDFARLKWTYQHQKLLEGQWGWSSKDRVYNMYVVFFENHECIFKDALNTTIHEQRACHWHVEMTTSRLSMTMDDAWMQGGFANPDAWKPAGGADNTDATLIGKW